nr:hypothetical protein 12 [Legionellales bacterium]
MITVPLYCLVAVGLVLLWLVFKLFEYKAKIVKPERVYVDTSGITDNPPNFIEVQQNKTINFVFSGEKVVIPYITVGDGLSKVKKIASYYKLINELHDMETTTRVEEIKNNMARSNIYKLAVKEIYKLSKPFAKHVRRFKKRFYKEANNNFELVMLITEQIFDYWMYIKKLLALLSRGGSLRMTIGGGFTWNSYATDIDGKLIIKPRYGLSTN